MSSNNDEVIFIELLDGAGEFEFLPCGLELLDQIGGAGEQDAISGIDQGVPERCGQVAFPGAWWAKSQDVGPGLEPGVTLGERCDPGLADHRHGGEVERVECLADRKPRLGQMALGSSLRPFGDFVLEERGKGARCRPAIPIRLFGDCRPEIADAGQSEFGAKQRQARGIGRAHAAISMCCVLSSRSS
jgi:hypothetical protein